MLAADRGHEEIVKLLLSRGAKINIIDKNAENALIFATNKGHKEIVELLLSKGAKVDVKNSQFMSKLTKVLFDGSYATIINASADNNKEAVEFFLEKGEDVNTVNVHTLSALMLAADRGHEEIVKLLLSRGANINIIDKNGENALIFATNKGHKEIVELLLSKGANVDFVNKNGDSALLLAAYKGNKEIVELLFNKGANIELSTSGFTPLIVAVREGHEETVAFLLEQRANIEAIYKNGENALALAIYKDHRKIVKLLLSRGAKYDIKDLEFLKKLTKVLFDGSYENIREACEDSNKGAVGFFLEKGAEIEMGDGHSASVLAIAASHGDKDIVELLLNAGAKVDIENFLLTENLTKALFNKSYKNIDEATKDENKGAVDFFLRYGANVSIHNVEFNKKYTKMFFGEAYGSIVEAGIHHCKDAVEFFFSKGASTEARDERGRTALIYAAERGRNETIEFLLSKGACAEDKDVYSHALMLAAFNGHAQTLNTLLKVTKNPLFTKVINAINLTGYEKIYFKASGLRREQLGATVEYVTDYKGHFDWSSKRDEIRSLLGLKNIELIDNHDGKYLMKVYNDSNEAQLVESLRIENQKPQFIRFVKENNASYIFFRNLDGVDISQWREKQRFIEDILNIPVEIEQYDHSHILWGKFGEEISVVIKESSISVMPDQLNIGGKYLKTVNEDGYETFYFTGVKEPKKWNDAKSDIIKIIGKRIEIIEDGINVKLKEATEEAIPRLLDLKDSHKNSPKLYYTHEDGNNKMYFYTFLPELDLNEWKEKSRKTNFRTLFNEPNKVYSLEIYDKSNKNIYDGNWYKGQLIILHEKAEIPSKEELFDIRITEEIQDDKIFWGFGSGKDKYYTSINLFPHMMIIGANGSGKSNFINGVILSLLNSGDKIKKMYLIDLKSGIEFNRYNELESEKIDVFSRGTKPSKLLAALHEVEVEMYLREEYMAMNGFTKIDKDPIFVIIDEFAQINLMHAKGSELLAKDEIYDTLTRIGTRARASNIKLIVQTQDPRSVGDDLKVHLMSRALLKTPKELDKDFTLQNPEMMDEQGIKHTRFDKGRYVFEDYNDGDTKFTELQFPFIDPAQNLHMTYQKKTHMPSEFDDSIFDEYKEYIASEYEYLANTKLLSGVHVNENIKTLEPKEQVVEPQAFTQDFNFDAFLDEETPEEEASEASDGDEFAEINSLYAQAGSLLAELKGKE